MRRGLPAVVLRGALLAALVAPAPLLPSNSFGSLGERLEQAQKTELFRWFSFQPHGKPRKAGDHTVVTFKPSGEVFHDVVTVHFTVDETERILGVELLLARSFVEDHRDEVFARDLARTFLMYAIAPKDLQNILELLSELEHGRPGPTPTAAWLTYLGERKAFEQEFPTSKLSLENTEIDRVASLRIKVSGR